PSSRSHPPHGLTLHSQPLSTPPSLPLSLTLRTPPSLPLSLTLLSPLSLPLALILCPPPSLPLSLTPRTPPSLPLSLPLRRRACPRGGAPYWNAAGQWIRQGQAARGQTASVQAGLGCC